MRRWTIIRSVLVGDYTIDFLVGVRAGKRGREFLVRWKKFDHYFKVGRMVFRQKFQNRALYLLTMVVGTEKTVRFWMF